MLTQIASGLNDIEDKMEEEDVFLTPVVHSAFSFSPKKVKNIERRKYRTKSKNEINGIGKPKESEDNDSEKVKKTKKNGREVFPCGIST